MLNKLLSEGEVQGYVTSLAARLFAKTNDACIWVIMDAAFMFAADLLRQMKGDKTVKFLYVERGYGEPGGPHPPHIYHMSAPPIFLTKYQHVFVDVICETGKTLEKVVDLVPDQQRRDLITCVLVAKGDAYTPTLVGKRVSDKYFLTGYGMGPYRDLPYIAERREK